MTDSERKQEAVERASTLAFVGRQPIYDRELHVVGYELLFRPHEKATQAGNPDPEQATAQVLLNTFLEIGLGTLVGSSKAFVNFSRNLLLSDYPLALPSTQVVIEVLETVTVDDKLCAAVGSLRKSGYTIALDDFTGQLHLQPLVPLADIVKVDLLGSNGADLDKRVTTLRQGKIKLLAEKVEERQDLRRCMELGFDYFQGYFLRRPEVVRGRRAPTPRASAVRLMERLCDPDVDLSELERLIQGDVSLSYKLLRLANSALLPAQSTIGSVRQALQLVGLTKVTLWTGLLLLTDLSDKPHDVLATALLRGHMCRLLCIPVAPRWENTSLLVGLFSVLDVLLDQPMEEVLEPLSLTPAVRQALVAHEGILGETLKIVIDYEQGHWQEIAAGPFEQPSIVKAYLDAVMQADEMTNLLGRDS